MSVLRHTWFMTMRQARNLAREPIWIVLLLVQPMVWLVLYGQLFKNVTRLGGFGTGSYITFLAPAIVVCTAWSSVGWYLLLLLGLSALTATWATWTFRAYQRSL